MSKTIAKTIFQKIIDRELPAEILYEDQDIICIKDKYPKAPIHFLLITKKVISSIHDITPEDYHLLGKLVGKAQELAVAYGVADNYRLLTNRGSGAGQSVFHLHFHLMAGKKLGGMD